MNSNCLKILGIFLVLCISLSSVAQEKKKKKGFFNKVGGLIKGYPGAFDALSADKYWAIFENPELADEEKTKLIADSLLKVTFKTKLSAYDEHFKGFYIANPRREAVRIKSTRTNQKYLVYLKGISKHRFLSMTNKDIKEKFEPSLFTTNSNVDIKKEKEGNQDIGVSMYFKPDTFFVDREGNRVVVAAISKAKVKVLTEPNPLELGETSTNLPFADRTIEDTEIYRIFKSKPFDKNTAWPRVCITITHLPENYQKFFFKDDNGQEKRYKRAIATATATIWYSENEKKEISEFTYFPCDFAAYKVIMADVGRLWAHGLNGYVGTKNNGYNREGPLHPINPIPIDQSDVKMCFTSGYGNWFFGDLLYKMDYNWNQDDTRVWFNVVDKSEDHRSVW